MDTPITRAEHEAFSRLMTSENNRLREENDRQNKRITALEDNARKVTDLTVSIRELAVNVQNMAAELKRQGDRMEQQAKRTGERLEKLESRDGEKWRSVAGFVLTTVLGIVLGVVCSRLGL